MTVIRLTFKDVLNDEIALRDDNQQRNVRPCKQAELLHVILLHERQHEPDKSNAVQAERQESMVGDEKAKGLDAIEQNSEVVEEILAVEEVVGSEKKVPGETAEPWQAVDSVHLVANRDDFLETFHLNGESLKRKNQARVIFKDISSSP